MPAAHPESRFLCLLFGQDNRGDCCWGQALEEKKLMFSIPLLIQPSLDELRLSGGFPQSALSEADCLLEDFRREGWSHAAGTCPALHLFA